MKLWKKVYKKIKRPDKWIEIKVPKAITKVTDKITKKSEEE